MRSAQANIVDKASFKAVKCFATHLDKPNRDRKARCLVTASFRGCRIRYARSSCQRLYQVDAELASVKLPSKKQVSLRCAFLLFKRCLPRDPQHQLHRCCSKSSYSTGACKAPRLQNLHPYLAQYITSQSRHSSCPTGELLRWHA